MNFKGKGVSISMVDMEWNRGKISCSVSTGTAYPWWIRNGGGGGYYSNPLKGHRGVTQGEPLPPMLFNVVVEVVVWHWITLLEGEEAGT